MSPAILYEAPETENPYGRLLASRGVALPLSEGEGGAVVDATGRQVFVVDVQRDLHDRDVAAIVSYLVVAINLSGGFKVLAGEAN
jgi:hypothetical protein